MIIFLSIVSCFSIGLYLKERHNRTINQINIKYLEEKLENSNIELKKSQEIETELQKRYHNLENLLTASNTRLQNEFDKQKSSEKIISEFQQNLEQMSAKIIQQNREVSMQESKQTLSALITPLQQNINEFKAKVDKVHTDDIKDRTGLKVSIEEQIKNVIEATKSIGTQANNLANALKGDKKMQGNWGERILNDILQNAGLQEGISYVSQSVGLDLINDIGESRRPDFILKMANNQSVILDAKVSLNNYEQYVNCENIEQKKQYFSDFIDDIKNHINNLASKGYHDLSNSFESISVLGSIIMFIPLESTYYETLCYENGFLHDYAWKKGIVIVGPYNLMPILKVLDSLSKIEKQNKNSQEIAKLGAQMYDKFVLLYEGIMKFRKNLDAIGKNFDEDIIKKLDGKGNLISKSEEMKKLGLKPSKQLNIQSNIEEEDTILL